jgi:hypothetical protein
MGNEACLTAPYPPPPAAPVAASASAHGQRRYRARQRDGLMVPTMPGIGADEISFLIETQWFDERDAAIGGRSDAPSCVRLLEINPEIANQTTVLAT